jgi:hypothetical protein
VDAAGGAITAHADKRTKTVVLRLSPDHEAEGWELLEELFRKEGRQDLWQDWRDHQKAVVAARALKQTIEPFPVAYLPAEVQRRRKGFAPNKVTWTAPTRAPIVVDEAGVVEAFEPEKAAGRPRKGA